MDFFSLMKSYYQLHRMLNTNLFQTETKWKDKVGIYFRFHSLMKVTVKCIERYMLIFSEWNKKKRWRRNIFWISFFDERYGKLHRMLNANLLLRLISSFSFSLKRFALSILCNWQWLPSKKKKSIIYSYLISSCFFQSEKIRIKHSMQLIITFIKEKKSIIYSYLISSFSFSLKRFA